MEDMLQILREVGLPSMLIGAFRHALKGVSDDDARGICARVGVGMFAICNGMPVREALSPDTLLDDGVMANIMVALQGGSLSLDIPMKRALEAAGGDIMYPHGHVVPSERALEAGGVEAEELWEEVSN
jgi:hypothetical protein